MQVYHIWFSISRDISDIEFAANVDAWLGLLRDRKLIEKFRLTRRTLGLASAELGEFHIEIEAPDLSAFDRVFTEVARREGEIEERHSSVYQYVRNMKTGLYRDFPGAERDQKS